MLRNRRIKVSSSAAGVAALILAGLWYTMMRVPATKTFRIAPSVVSHPLFIGPLFGASGQPLLARKQVPALMVVPDQLPTWVRQDLVGHVSPKLMKQSQFLWNGSSNLFRRARGWSVSGLYPVTLQEWVPGVGVSWSLAKSWGEAHGQYGVAQLNPDHGVFSPAAKTVAERLAWSASLSQRAMSLVPSGGIFAAVDGQGRVRTLLANPSQRAIAWNPRPLGLGLVPALTAEALGSPKILLSVKGSSDLLGQLATAFGPSKIKQGLLALGMGSASSLAGQPIKNPTLPQISASVMSQGHALWATPLELARAYLPFIRHGLLPQLTASLVPEPLQTHGVPLVANSSNLTEVAQALPTVMVNGQKFSVWRPAGNFAVAFTESHGGMVLVAEGSATDTLLALVHVVGIWMQKNAAH